MVQSYRGVATPRWMNKLLESSAHRLFMKHVVSMCLVILLLALLLAALFGYPHYGPEPREWR
jgi:hypothetical protein